MSPTLNIEYLLRTEPSVRPGFRAGRAWCSTGLNGAGKIPAGPRFEEAT